MTASKFTGSEIRAAACRDIIRRYTHRADSQITCTLDDLRAILWNVAFDAYDAGEDLAPKAKDGEAAAVSRIMEGSFPLASGNDWPIGPIPAFKVRALLTAAYRAGARDHQSAPCLDLASRYEEMIHEVRALFHGASALHDAGDSNGVANLLSLALREIDRQFPEGATTD